MKGFLEFPNPVNELAARTVAAVVALGALVVLLTQAWWLLVLLAIGFALRVAFGPRVSPAALLATRVVAPRLGAPRLVPGPPKRFAQAIGLVLTSAASALALTGFETTALVLVGALLVAAGLEAVLGFCLGCRIFALLMRIGLIPGSVCVACANATGAHEVARARVRPAGPA